jgi:hypothetical protein
MANAQDIKWSKTEKTVARRAFGSAYGRECEAITKHLNGMILDIADPEDIWHLHDFLDKKRKEIDQKYDYRYSVLILVFARLMQEGWLKESDLDGLHEDKAYQIKALANL